MSNTELPLTSNRPYLLRAIYDWLLDNQLTPQILIDASYDNVQVPRQYVKDGQILLNISADAVNNLVMDNHHVSFSARFSGSPMLINAPIAAILAIFSRENGQGMAFPNEPEIDQTGIAEETEQSHLLATKAEIEQTESTLESDGIAVDENIDNTQQKSKKSKPTLKIVK